VGRKRTAVSRLSPREGLMARLIGPRGRIYHRVDDFLTIIFDETKIIPVGFKLKGFKHVFNTHLKSLFELNDKQFLVLATTIEAVCTELGDTLFADDERTRWYKAARKLAANDNVKLYGSLFQKQVA
jgi:hypothetical protein